MSIVPCGNRKSMESQSYWGSIEGADLGSEKDIKSLVRVAQIVEDIDPNAVRGNLDQDPDSFGLDAQGPQEDLELEQPEEAIHDANDSSLRKYIFQLLEGLGIPGRILDKTSDKVFKSTEDLANGTLSGHYLIPTYTAKGEVGESEAKQIAQQISSQFGLIQKLENSGSNYKITFQSGSAQTEEDEASGTSFDRLLSGGDKGSNSKAASTVQEMIKESREQCLDGLLKSAQGDK